MGTESSVADPRLPYELERVIFEIAAKTSRYPVFTADILARVRAVAHLFLDNTVAPSVVQAILSTCTRVTHLFLSSSAGRYLNALTEPQCLRRLSIDLHRLLHCCVTEGSHPLLCNITHLELLDYERFEEDPETQDLGALLALIPHLTHIAFNTAPQNLMFYSTIRAITTLQCILFLDLDADNMENPAPLADDSRFVCIDQQKNYCIDWSHGADTGEDFWALADAFIGARRAGKVGRAEYSICDLDFYSDRGSLVMHDHYADGVRRP
ncbi:hypothetical protein B0H13DRAFT_2002182 [Mycena leptocephala]|nr:hypothetical protein B0H13DRAFT_2002182 [Mycena leptocephala]